MSEFGEPERVHIENEWYDGPRAGIAEIQGELYRFKSTFSEEYDDYADTFVVFPITDQIYKLEKEQWLIFVHWNDKFELGEQDTSSHPAKKGNNERWEEIEALLRDSRSNTPKEAKFAQAKFVRIDDQKHRYEELGPDYMLSWRIGE